MLAVLSRHITPNSAYYHDTYWPTSGPKLLMPASERLFYYASMLMILPDTHYARKLHEHFTYRHSTRLI